MVILVEMKHHFCGRCAILEGDVPPLEREELDTYRLILPLLHRHIVDVSDLVTPTGSGGERPHTTDGAIAYKLWWYKITVYHGVIRAGCEVDCVRYSSGGEEHNISQTPTSQFGKVPR